MSKTQEKQVYVFFKSIDIFETVIGVGGSSITVSYDKKIQEIAYKFWIELKTRKIVLKFDEENDVILEVYNSWYQAFGIIRSLLEEISVEKIKYASGLIDITTKVLNEGLRLHLTKWQAKYRRWYEIEKDKHIDMSPQELQKLYPFFNELIEDLKVTNEIMIHFSDELEKNSL